MLGKEAPEGFEKGHSGAFFAEKVKKLVKILFYLLRKTFSCAILMKKEQENVFWKHRTQGKQQK